MLRKRLGTLDNAHIDIPIQMYKDGFDMILYMKSVFDVGSSTQVECLFRILSDRLDSFTQFV